LRLEGNDSEEIEELLEGSEGEEFADYLEEHGDPEGEYLDVDEGD
jgi:hypothetical protein